MTTSPTDGTTADGMNDGTIPLAAPDPASSGGYADPGGTPIPPTDPAAPTGVDAAVTPTPAAGDATPTPDAGDGTNAPEASPPPDPATPTSTTPEAPSPTPIAPVPTDQVPDNPSTTATPPAPPDPTLNQTHDWSAGSCGFDIGPVKASAIDDAWRTAQADEHGVTQTHPGEADYVMVPAHLRDIEDASLAYAKAIAAAFGPDDDLTIRFRVDEFNGDVTVDLSVERAPAVRA